MCIGYIDLKVETYFYTHPVKMLIDQPLKLILYKLDMSRTFTKQTTELSEFNIVYQLQTIYYFIVEHILPQIVSQVIKQMVIGQNQLNLYVDMLDTKNGLEMSMVLKALEG